MQLSQVGREQAIEKDGPAVLAAQQAVQAQKKDIEAKEAVGKPEEPSDGAAAVKERSGSGAQAGGGRAGDEEKPERGSEGAGEEIIRDPSLGTKVDLSG
jgi:hypothetical protein